jgi:hypothetical protein
MKNEVSDKPNMFQRAMNFLNKRKLAYGQVFRGDSIANQVVMADLAKFCRAVEPTFHADARVHARLEGRREVFLRITEHLNLSAEELYNLYSKGQIK